MVFSNNRFFSTMAGPSSAAICQCTYPGPASHLKLTCDDHSCKRGSLKRASCSIPCRNPLGCTDFECCEEPNCSDHVCRPENVKKTLPSSRLCQQNVCEEWECCNNSCSSFQCPADHARKVRSRDILCPTGLCQLEDCCDKQAKCGANFPCKLGTPSETKVDVLCSTGACTAMECCDPPADPPCKNINCLDGTQLKFDSPFIQCDGPCEPAECCARKPTCVSYTCQTARNKLKLNAAQIICNDLLCSETECCDVPIAATCPPTEFETRPNTINFNLMGINDLYEMNPVLGGKEGGMARLATIKQQYQKQNPQTLLVLAGDLISPSAIGSASHEGVRIGGEHMIATANAMKLDIASLGNHEFDFGNATLAKRIGESNFDWITANAWGYNKVSIPGVKPSTSRTMQNADGKTVKVCFFGIVIAKNVDTSVWTVDADYTAGMQRNARFVVEERSACRVAVSSVCSSHLFCSSMFVVSPAQWQRPR